MRTMLLAVLAAGATLTVATPSEARQGCGVGAHRGAHGYCRPNRAGIYYRGHGWWDGHRYWQHRYRWHRGWRYR